MRAIRSCIGEVSARVFCTWTKPWETRSLRSTRTVQHDPNEVAHPANATCAVTNLLLPSAITRSTNSVGSSHPSTPTENGDVVAAGLTVSPGIFECMPLNAVPPAEAQVSA